MIELSIIIPIYNVEEYLEQCLESIYKLKINKEVILVNDESPDNSYLIIEKYKKLYPKETVVINQKNKGLSGARNSGLEIAIGKYISFIDSDDFINTEEYEEVFNKNKNKQLDIIIGSYQKYQNNTYLDMDRINNNIKNLGIITGKDFFEKNISFNSFKVEVWDDIYSREFLLKNNLKFKERLLHEDILFSIQSLIKAKKVEKFFNPIYIYRQREGSITSNFTYKNRQHYIYILINLLEIQENTTRIKGLNNFIINILWWFYRSQKEVNTKILKQLLFKELYPVKEYIKIMIMFIYSTRCKEIEPIQL